MGLFSLFRKNKQEPSTGDGKFYSRAEEESSAIRGRGKRKSNQAKEQVDPVLPEKKRARRRLVGAIALVLAAIIGLPMIFDSEPKQVSEDVAIQIPSKEKPMPESGSGQLPVPAPPKAATPFIAEPDEEIVNWPKPSSAAPGASATLPADEPARAAIAAPAVAVAKSKENAKSSAADKSTGAARKNAELKVETKGGTRVGTKVESRAVPKAVAAVAPPKRDDSARANAILEAKPEEKSLAPKLASDSKPEKFVIQVAAFAAKEKVNALQGRLKSAGINSYTQRVATASGERTRIRIGPLASKQEADSVRAKLTRLGLNGTLVPAAH